MRLTVLVVLALALTAEARPPARAKSAFERVPKDALTALKATVGKPFTAGLVFIDGKYIEPPYTVERFGTAIRVNGKQVSGPLIPWDEFLKTQDGAKVETVSAGAPTEVEVEETVEETVESDSDDMDLDDLFDDAPAKPKAKRKVSRKVKKTAAPAVTTKVTFDGPFKPNDKTRAMVAKLNKIRTDTEVNLRNGGYCFFGSKYSPVTGDRGAADLLLSALPKAMKAGTDYSAFFNAASARHIAYLPADVLRDLYRNRIDYVKLQEREKSLKGERQWEALLNQ